MLIISLIIFAIIALIVAAVLGLLSSIVAWRIVRRRNWSHKRLIVLLAAITPTLFIGMEAVLGLIGSVYISETKGVDLGFGDYWEAPLSASHYLSAVDKSHIQVTTCRFSFPNDDGMTIVMKKNV